MRDPLADHETRLSQAISIPQLAIWGTQSNQKCVRETLFSFIFFFACNGNYSSWLQVSDHTHHSMTTGTPKPRST